MKIFQTIRSKSKIALKLISQTAIRRAVIGVVTGASALFFGVEIPADKVDDAIVLVGLIGALAGWSSLSDDDAEDAA